eukprot:482022-Heterocapsa_arctica.AAC.1
MVHWIYHSSPRSSYVDEDHVVDVSLLSPSGRPPSSQDHRALGTPRRALESPRGSQARPALYSSSGAQLSCAETSRAAA